MEINRRLEVGPKVTPSSDFKEHNPRGDMYSISSEVAYRSMQTFSFVLNRRVYKEDVEKFTQVVGSVVKSHIKGMWPPDGILSLISVSLL